MDIQIISSTKSVKIWLGYLIYLCLLVTSHVEAVNNLQEIKTISDDELNTIVFSTTLINQKMQIYQIKKLYGDAQWGSREMISDPEVGVNSYEVKKDKDYNIVVTWLGEDTVLGIYCLYIKYFVKSTENWSPIIRVSDPSQNLAGYFSSSINTQTIEVIWTAYDEDFNLENYSTTLNI